MLLLSCFFFFFWLWLFIKTCRYQKVQYFPMCSFLTLFYLGFSRDSKITISGNDLNMQDDIIILWSLVQSFCWPQLKLLSRGSTTFLRSLLSLTPPSPFHLVSVSVPFLLSCHACVVGPFPSRTKGAAWWCLHFVTSLRERQTFVVYASWLRHQAALVYAKGQGDKTCLVSEATLML